MSICTDDAPEIARFLLMREVHRSPDASVYDLCHRIEDMLDRRTYHSAQESPHFDLSARRI